MPALVSLRVGLAVPVPARTVPPFWTETVPLITPEPPTVRCGDVLRASATLTADLSCPDNVAVTIAASNVVLDLGGHTITTPATTLKDTGIVVNGPGITNVDASIIRNFKLWSNKTLQFRLEAFNALNNPIWNDPNTTLTSPLYGTITTTRKPMRELQIGLKFVF